MNSGTMKPRSVLAASLAFAVMLLSGAPLRAAEETALPADVPPPPEGAPPQDAPPAESAPPPNDGRSAERTPPRLSFVDGTVSFWRPGAEDWAPAQINTPLAPGDALYASAGANLELQIGARAFVRAGAGTQLSLENQEPNFLQFKVTAGHLGLDLRSIAAGHTIEIDTPNAAFTVDHTGYYRVDVDGDTTTFTTRRGGYAAMTPAGGQLSGISPSEQMVITGTDVASVETYAAPELDSWDHWNDDRTNHLIDTSSTRYVPPGVYGADALDHYGNWRVVGSYGPVWVPEGVAPTWAPYSTGRWLWDPYYGWTWVDAAPWGWAPYHYGRWVYVNNYWGWAPGPVVATPLYAPALVAFFGGSGFGLRLGIGVPPVGWVALGWGEPCIPWWGRPGFVGRPWWGGWGGPHVVNNTIINNTTIVNVNNINIYRNVGVRNAVVVVPRDRFGRGGSESARLWNIDSHRLRPMHGPLPVKPSPASLLPASGRGVRPPESILHRRVVGTRPFHDPTRELQSAGLKTAPSLHSPEPRLVAAPRQTRSAPGTSRPPLGPAAAPERARPSLPPRFHENAPQKSAPRQAPPGETVQPRPRHPAPPVLTNVGPHFEGPRPEGPRPVEPRLQGVPRPGPQPVAPRPEAPRRQAPRPQTATGAPVRSAPVQVQPPPPVQPLQVQPPPPQVQPPRSGPVRVPPPRGAPQRGGPAPALAPQVQRPQPRPRPLPGEPANRGYPGQGGSQPRQLEAPRRAPAAPHAPAPRGGSGGLGRSPER